MSEIGSRINVHTGDITKLAVDAIINAANDAKLTRDCSGKRHRSTRLKPALQRSIEHLLDRWAQDPKGQATDFGRHFPSASPVRLLPVQKIHQTVYIFEVVNKLWHCLLEGNDATGTGLSYEVLQNHEWKAPECNCVEFVARCLKSPFRGVSNALLYTDQSTL